MKFAKRTILGLGILLLIAFVVACAAPQKTPVVKKQENTDWKYHTIVDAAFVKAHMAIPMPENVMLIDSRPYRPKYAKGHIPMAVSIPHSKFDKMITQLPENKDALLIYYCEGPT